MPSADIQSVFSPKTQWSDMQLPCVTSQKEPAEPTRQSYFDPVCELPAWSDEPNSCASSSDKSCLRSSLKSSRSRSAPSTPVATKSVHFDIPLERITLFHEQPERTQATSESYTNRDDNTWMVTLESLLWDSPEFTLTGTVQVQNIAYRKEVSVRYSLDDWQTSYDVQAVFKESYREHMDRFQFQIHLGRVIRPYTRISLAVRYHVGGRDFWDNNRGRNFNAHWAPSRRFSSPWS
ncbi:putative phosphatase regulatory subunit-domain-containing protein [Radiomyces spectabilis]|uniref:putative phosphatase regulatory subunit-domain-containing protein n=1 Tax=Radiomyces spectabilis TaxID=64574 RepID=UPI00221FC80A|nr:putative phosphatase regulatory subunit-domain-containing protein [Radiomyces spectabilis]KAI8374239.1 putative phosphatase regulatory subunit-domain-containing protein [Radiomyces spectabilis]